MALRQDQRDEFNQRAAHPTGEEPAPIAQEPAEPIQPEAAQPPVPKTDPDPMLPVVDPVTPPATPDRDPGYAALKASMDRQFRGLQQSIADLQQDLSSVQEPDLRGIIAKIDATRASLEQQIAALGTASPSGPELSGEQMARLEAMIQSVCEKQDRNDRQISQTLRENANFQIQVRQNMQRELDGFRERQTGEQFNPMLKEIARIYVEYQAALQGEDLPTKFRNNLESMFEELSDLLSEYDAEIIASEVGSVRRPKACKIVGKLPTWDQNLHNTIARSIKPGVMRDRVVLYPEYVDVFVYDSTVEPPVPEVPADVPEEPVTDLPPVAEAYTETPAEEPAAPAEDTPATPEETNI